MKELNDELVPDLQSMKHLVTYGSGSCVVGTVDSLHHPPLRVADCSGSIDLTAQRR